MSKSWVALVGPFLVRFINNLARVNVGDLGTAAKLADGITNPTGTATIATPTSGAATFTGAGDGFAGPGFTFAPGSSPTLADMQFYLNGIPAVTALNAAGGVFIQGPANNAAGAWTLSYPVGRIVDPLTVAVAPVVAGLTSPTAFPGQTPATAMAIVTPPIAQLPAAVSVAPGSTLILDNSVTNIADRLPNNQSLILNGSSLYIKENSASATTETMGNLILAADTSNTLRIDAGLRARSSRSTAAAVLTRMAGATLNIYNTGIFSAAGSYAKRVAVYGLHGVVQQQHGGARRAAQRAWRLCRGRPSPASWAAARHPTPNPWTW